MEPENKSYTICESSISFLLWYSCCGSYIPSTVKLKNLLTILPLLVLHSPENSVELSSFISIRTLLKLSSSVPLLHLYIYIYTYIYNNNTHTHTHKHTHTHSIYIYVYKYIVCYASYRVDAAFHACTTIDGNSSHIELRRPLQQENPREVKHVRQDGQWELGDTNMIRWP
jgi:hypothetical protein